MSWPWESESEQAQREHNEAQEMGANDDILDQGLHALLSPFYSDAHNAGYDNGVANPSNDD